MDIGKLTVILNPIVHILICIIFLALSTMIVLFYTILKYFEFNCNMIIQSLDKLKFEKNFWKRNRRFMHLVEHHKYISL